MTIILMYRNTKNSSPKKNFGIKLQMLQKRQELKQSIKR